MSNHGSHGALGAEASLTCVAPRDFGEQLAEHLAGHDATVSTNEFGWEARFHYGTASVVIETDGLRLRVRADDPAALNGVRHMVTALAEFVANDPALRLDWKDDGIDGTAPPNFRRLVVTEVETLTPRMLRIRFRSADLQCFASSRHTHVRLLFPPSNLQEPEWPKLGKDGRVIWPQGDARLASRIYTLRHIDPEHGTLDIDFALHDADGPGLTWARGARPGAFVGMLGPGGRGLKLAEWHAFFGDETGLPGIARMLESLPADARGQAFIEVADERERQELAHPEGVQCRWLYRNEQTRCNDLLVRAAAELDWPTPDREIFAWIGCEYGQYRALLENVLGHGVPKPNVVGFAHWRRGLNDEEALAQSSRERSG